MNIPRRHINSRWKRITISLLRHEARQEEGLNLPRVIKTQLQSRLKATIGKRRTDNTELSYWRLVALKRSVAEFRCRVLGVRLAPKVM
jgi:hypothetical protein